MYRTNGFLAVGLAFALGAAGAFAQTTPPATAPAGAPPAAGGNHQEKQCEHATKWLAAAKEHLTKTTEAIAKAPADKQAAAKALLDEAATHLPLAEAALTAGNCKEALSQLQQFHQGREAAHKAAGLPGGEGHGGPGGAGGQGGHGGRHHGKGPGAGGAAGTPPAAAH